MTESQREEEIREDEKSIETKRIKGQDGKGLQQLSAGVPKGAVFPPL